MRITNNQLNRIIKLSTVSTENNTVIISYDNDYFYLNLEYDILNNEYSFSGVCINEDEVDLSTEQEDILEGFLNELTEEAEDKAKAKELEVIDYYEYNGKN